MKQMTGTCVFRVPRQALIGFVFLLTGCMASPTPVPVASQAPYFLADSQDIKAFQALGKKQDSVVAKCGSTGDCDQALYLRGMIALFENRDVARSHFQKVVAMPQKSRYAPASQHWLQLLQSTSVGPRASWINIHTHVDEITKENGNLSRTLEQLVRDLLARESDVQHLVSAKDAESTTVEALQRELAERQKKIEELTVKKEPARAGADTATVTALQGQLEQRDKKIQELTHQLEALKRIDQEMREKARPIRPTVTPPLTPGDGEQKP